MSHGEPEFYATLEASAETLGIVPMMADFGLKMIGGVWGDAQAVLGITSRNGFGKTRHIQTGLLWTQQVPAHQRLIYGKVFGKENPADLYTKYLDNAVGEHHLNKWNCRFIEGRASEAPKLKNLSASFDECSLIWLWTFFWMDRRSYSGHTEHKPKSEISVANTAYAKASSTHRVRTPM